MSKNAKIAIFNKPTVPLSFDSPAGTLKMRDMKMQDWKMRHKVAKGGKCRNGKSRKRKIWKAVCKIIIWRYAYRMR